MGDSILKVYQDLTRYILQQDPNFNLFLLGPILKARGVISETELEKIQYSTTPLTDETRYNCVINLEPIVTKVKRLFLQIMPLKDERSHDELVLCFTAASVTNTAKAQFLAQRLATYRQAYQVAAAPVHQGGPRPKIATLVSMEKRSNVYKLLRKKLGTTYDINGILGGLYSVDVITFEEREAIIRESGTIDKLIKLFDQFMPPKELVCHQALITYFTDNRQSEFAEFLEKNLFQ